MTDLLEFDVPPFPAGDQADAKEVADWAELHVLSTGKTLTIGDLRSTVTREDVGSSDALLTQAWDELGYRRELFGSLWPLALSEARLSQGQRQATPFYVFLCALGLRYNIDSDGRVLFELCVNDLVRGLSKHYAMRLGHPARPPMSTSFRRRVGRYADRSRLHEAEIKLDVPATDNDLGLDVVTWSPFGDGRGGEIHFVGQCATGTDWLDKLQDLNLDVWSDHINWFVPPVRFFATPIVISPQRWPRASRKGGLLLDRFRLVELERRGWLRKRWSPRVGAYCAELYE